MVHVFCYFCITLYTATKTITDFNENVLKWISVQLHIKPTPKLGKLEKSKSEKGSNVLIPYEKKVLFRNSTRCRFHVQTGI